MNKLLDWYYRNIQRQVVRKVKDLPNPNARVIVWEMFDLSLLDSKKTLSFIVKALEMPASEWVLKAPLSIDARDPSGDMVILLFERRKHREAVTVALSEIKKKMPEIEQKLMTPQQALDLMGKYGAALDEIQVLNQRILDSLDN